MVKYKKSKKKVNKGFLVLNKGEATGMAVLLSLIAILLLFSIFRPVMRLSKRDRMAFHNLDSLLAVQEAEKQAYLAEQARLMEQESQRKEERKANSRPFVGKSQNSSRKELVHKSQEPIPPQKKSERVPVIEIIDVNLADSTTLLDLPQIGTTMSSRIHRYRERLGGFVSLEQLYEVKGMDSARFEAIQPYILLGPREVRKLHVNSDEFKVLLRHPYLDYDQVKTIVNHRERKGLITNWPQLQGLVGDCNPLLEQYVQY